MSDKKTRPALRHSEQGMVAIMTTMVLMIVISLIVLGFAQISRRNQRESLDRQLSTQAFYAAETGVNDVRELIQTAVANGTAVAEKNGCTDAGVGGFYSSLNPDIDTSRGVKYSCLLVDPTPSVLRYRNVNTTSTIIPVIRADGSSVNRIQLDWQSLIPGATTAGCPTSVPAAAGNGVFQATGAWTCAYGVLRFDLVPTGSNRNADQLRNATMTTFAVPFASGGVLTIPYSASTANTNNVRGVRCTATGCSLEISGLTENSYHMRVTSLYREVALQVCAEDATGACRDLQGAQAVIDSTGKAQDVLRRIQVNVPLRGTSKNELSDFALQTNDSICKRYSVMTGFFDTVAPAVTSTNRLCQP